MRVPWGKQNVGLSLPGAGSAASVAMTRATGFTLIEVLAASLLLALGVASICGVCARALSQAQLDQQREAAWRLVDRQFNIITAMGIDAFVLEDEAEGTEDYFGKEYYWTAGVREADLDGLYTVNVTVSWQDNQRWRRVAAATQYNGTLPLASLSR